MKSSWHIPDRLAFLLPLLRPFEQLAERLQDGPVGRLWREMIERLRKIGLVSSIRRFVLTIGDEGAVLVSFQGMEVTDALFVGLESEEGPETLRSYLAEDPQAELLVSADMLEQMYREEQLPQVSRWDRMNILKRRLDVAFPHDRLKASVPLQRGEDGTATVLFTALPETRHLAPWIEFLESLSNPVTGFCLLPLESEGLAAKLTTATEDDGRKVWHALVSQQATSGFRQIFEADGHLVVTRLTQRPPGELTAESIAQLIERELRSSISYIKRLGYAETDRLELVVLASADICDAVSKRDLPITALTVLTPRQAAMQLGLGEVGPEDSPFSDVLHAVTLASKRHPRAVLPTEKFKERLQLDLMFKISFASAAAVTLIATLYIGSILFNAYDTLSTAQTLERAVATETLALDSLRQKTHSYEIPLEELVAVTQIDDSLQKAQIDPTDFMRTVGTVLEPSVRVQKIVYTAKPSTLLMPASPAATNRAAKKEIESAYEIQVTLRFDSDMVSDSDQIVRTAKVIKDRLAKAFPGLDVSVQQLPFSALRTEVLQGGAGTGPIGATSGLVTAQYLIRKRL